MCRRECSDKVEVCTREAVERVEGAAGEVVNRDLQLHAKQDQLELLRTREKEMTEKLDRSVCLLFDKFFHVSVTYVMCEGV